MRPRDLGRLYQTAARLWLTAAGFSLFLPPSVRLGSWLPLHLALVGGVSVAISGAMQGFVAALTAGPPTPSWMVWTQFTLTNAGVVLLAAGRSADVLALVSIGGTAFLLGIAALGAIVLRARRRSMLMRHPIPITMYGLAISSVLAGGAIGIVMGTGLVHSAVAYIRLRDAHMVVNVLGWAGLTIAGTLITFLPTVLRVRMPPWRGRFSGVSLACGVGLAAAGLALGLEPVAVLGGVAFAAGAAGLLSMVRRVLATPRRWPVPASARHILSGLMWFAGGTAWLVVALVHGPTWMAGSIDLFVVVFACGWVLQTLLGAWLYMLPAMRPGHPDQRRRMWAATEIWIGVEVITLNAGLVLLALRTSTIGPVWFGTVGPALALFGAGLALLKAWTYPALAHTSLSSNRARRMWDPRKAA